MKILIKVGDRKRVAEKGKRGSWDHEYSCHEIHVHAE